jgi:hypothetical protein
VIVERVAPLLMLAALTGCSESPSAQPAPSGPTFEPTEPRLLSTGSPTKDEDPSVLRARDGTMFVAWFSDRGGNPDLYLTSTANGSDWSAPVRVTTHPGGDFNPHLIQDDQGTFHLVWFRWEALFRGNIRYNSSRDGRTWDPAGELAVTTDAGVDDWVPTIARLADGTLRVYFVSTLRDASNRTSEIYVASRPPSATAFGPAAKAAGVNSTAEHDHLPFVARTGSDVSLVWVRHDTTEPLPWLNHKSDLMYSTSPDGLAWRAPTRATNDGGSVVNLFPTMFAGLDGRWSLLWLSTRGGNPRVFELPLASVGSGAGSENASLPAGYSHKVAATSTPGVDLAAWVQGPEGAQDVYYRFFRR